MWTDSEQRDQGELLHPQTIISETGPSQNLRLAGGAALALIALFAVGHIGADLTGPLFGIDSSWQRADQTSHVLDHP